MAGSTILIPVQHDETLEPIVANDSYFAIWLYSAHAFVEAPWLTQTAYLVCSTEVSSTFTNDAPRNSIHKVTTVRKNTPSPLGLSVQLTDWLPAIPDRTVSVGLKLVAVRDNPFGRLTDKISQLGLVSTLTLAGAQFGQGARVAEIAGKMLSALLEEGRESTVLPLHADIAVAGLSSGYYATIAPAVAGDYPTAPQLRTDGSIRDSKAPFSDRNSYAVLKVHALARRGPNAVRTTTWWPVLEDGRRQAERAAALGDRERRKALVAWLDVCERAERLAEQDLSYLRSEQLSIFQEQTQYVRRLLTPASTGESTGSGELPEELQRILGVADDAALDRAVSEYHAKLARSDAEPQA